MNKQRAEIVCDACGKETFVRRQAVYDDAFRKTGEKFICISCGHEYDGEEDVPFKDGGAPDLLEGLKQDLPSKSELFSEETVANCRHCRNYVVNPFTQRCALSEREVEATDSCDSFEASDDSEEKRPQEGDSQS